VGMMREGFEMQREQLRGVRQSSRRRDRYIISIIICTDMTCVNCPQLSALHDKSNGELKDANEELP
jgi:hypothetical protein